MTLFDIAIKNIKKNFYNYFVYFFSMIFSIVIYYTFVSLQYNQQVATASATSAKIFYSFQSSAVILAIFSAIFIWYSNSFFTKKRKKEVGLYSLFGLRKRQIARMLFYENIVMGILALIFGILLGTLLSKLFSMILLNMMGTFVYIKFEIVPKAIIQTTIVFLIFIFIASIHSYSLIYRFKLIDLFKADSKKQKEPNPSLFLTFLGILILALCYYVAINAGVKLEFLSAFFGSLFLAILGTYVFFRSSLIWFLKRNKKNKNKFYKGTNIISTSQVLYRVKTNAVTLATLALLSAVTITAIGTVFSFVYMSDTAAKIASPFSFTVDYKNENVQNDLKNIIKDNNHKILNSVEGLEILKLEAKFNPKNSSGFFFFQNKSYVQLIKQSDYNKIADIKHFPKINLKNDKDAILFDGYYIGFGDFSFKDTDVTLMPNDRNINLKIIEDPYKKFVISASFADRVLVVKDDMYENLKDSSKIIKTSSYDISDQTDSEKLTNELVEFTKNNNIKFVDYYRPYKGTMESNGVLIFSGTFLGLVFLLSTGSIIYFKQLNEANEDKMRYKIISNIGISFKDIKKSISSQILTIFLSPLIIGLIHSTVAISKLSQLLGLSLVKPYLITSISYSVIYIIFYFLTVATYTRIIKQK